MAAFFAGGDGEEIGANIPRSRWPDGAEIMAYVVEIVGRPGVYLVMSNTDQQIGVINGSDDEWYWQIFGSDVVYETSLARAKAAALREAKILEDKFLTGH